MIKIFLFFICIYFSTTLSATTTPYKNNKATLDQILSIKEISIKELSKNKYEINNRYIIKKENIDDFNETINTIKKLQAEYNQRTIVFKTIYSNLYNKKTQEYAMLFDYELIGKERVIKNLKISKS